MMAEVKTTNLHILENAMEEIGKNLYALSAHDLAEQMPCEPRGLLTFAVKGSLGSPASDERGRELQKRQEEIAGVVLKFSISQHVWCGIEWPLFVKELKAHGRPYNAHLDGIAFAKLVKAGFVRILKKFSWWPATLLNGLWPQPICPTPRLAKAVLNFNRRGGAK